MKLFLFLALSFFSVSVLNPRTLWAQEQKQETKSAPKKLIMIGDSLTEGFGVAKSSAYPALLEKKLQAAGKNWTVINSGVGGSTSASGVSRLKWQLKSKPDMIFLALGANDGLRGVPVGNTEKNLSETIELAQKENVPVILAGIMVPPNYGEKYANEFEAIYKRVAKKYKVHYVPFLLKDVAGVTNLNQTDGIHPNEKGHEVIAENIYQAIKGWL